MKVIGSRKTMGRSRTLAGIALAAVLAVACAPAEKGVTQTRTGDPVVVITEGECDQTCPVYDMTLHPDGTYLLNGVRFVKTPGVSEGRLDASAWADAEAALEKAGFWSLEPDQTSSSRPSCVSGAPKVTITVRNAEGKQKTLAYKPGCGGEEAHALIPSLRAALHFDDLIWTDARFAPDGSR